MLGVTLVRVLGACLAAQLSADDGYIFFVIGEVFHYTLRMILSVRSFTTSFTRIRAQPRCDAKRPPRISVVLLSVPPNSRTDVSMLLQ
jgi:hypothetical protein